VGAVHHGPGVGHGVIDATVVGIALPAIGHDYGASLAAR
jgi:hypothetical protein